MTLAKNVMLDVSATAVAFFSKRLKMRKSAEGHVEEKKKAWYKKESDLRS